MVNAKKKSESEVEAAPVRVYRECCCGIKTKALVTMCISRQFIVERETETRAAINKA